MWQDTFAKYFIHFTLSDFKCLRTHVEPFTTRREHHRSMVYL